MLDQTALVTAAAVFLDLCIGDPVYRLHPIRVIGNFIISPLEKALRKRNLEGRSGGGVLLAGTLFFSVAPVAAVDFLLQGHPLARFVFQLYIVYSCIAIRDLRDHSARVVKALMRGDLPAARKALSFIVGRETKALDGHAVGRGCVETIAENLSDGIVAPLFYAVIGGAPLAILYKAANTMDSMVGYKNEKYREFGRYPAKFDDVLNFIPARLSLLFVLIAGKGGFRAWRQALADRLRHSSPNAGHPEAAMAAVLGLRLGGPSVYHGAVVEKPWLNPDGRDTEAKDVAESWNVGFRAAILALVAFLAFRLVVP